MKVDEENSVSMSCVKLIMVLDRIANALEKLVEIDDDKKA